MKINVCTLSKYFIDDMMECHDYNWNQIQTPINVPVLKDLLQKSDYSKEKLQFIIKGFTQGFNIGYQGPEDRTDESRNIPLQIGSQTEMWNKLTKEVNLHRIAGPYTKEQLPFKNYIQ